MAIELNNIVIKIANPFGEHRHFIQGCANNLKERYYTKVFKGSYFLYNKISPTLFCSLFGLFSFQKKVQLLDRPLLDEEKEYFKNITTDFKPENFGYLKNKLVCIDYE